MQLVVNKCSTALIRFVRNKSIPFKDFLRCFAVQRPRIPRLTSGKVCQKCQAVGEIKDGARILVGGYGLCGLPEFLLRGLVKTGAKNLTLICADAGNEHSGLGVLIRNRQVSKVITSAIRDNHLLVERFFAGDIALEIYPQGTLAECIRAGGMGIPAFLTSVGVGTMVQEGGIPVKYNKSGEIELSSGGRAFDMIDGNFYVREDAITAEWALVKAFRGDSAGNLIFRKSARNFNPIMCKAATHTIVEVDEIVPLGKISPEDVHVPGIFVDRVVHTQKKDTRVQNLRLQTPSIEISMALRHSDFNERERIIRRGTLEVKSGMTVVLAPGLPQYIVEYVPSDVEARFITQNGILGMGTYPATADKVDPDIINGVMETVTEMPGAAYMSSEESYGLIRSGRVDLIIMGAIEVSQYGDVANWINPIPFRKGHRFYGIGCAMDFVAANYKNTRVVIVMKHNSKENMFKILSDVQIPLSGKLCADLIITEKAVFQVNQESGLTLMELGDGVSIEDVVMTTGCTFEKAPEVERMRQCPIVHRPTVQPSVTKTNRL